jgi:hypothetical protein
MFDVYEGIDITYDTLMTLPLHLKTESFPISWDQNGEATVLSNETPITILNQFNCDKLEFKKHSKSLRKHFNIQSDIPSIPRLEADCFQVARHLVREVIPLILAKYKKPVDLPILMHYRCRTLLHNLSLNWLFAMLLPADMRINLIDLLKTRGRSGMWDVFFAGCGYIQTHNYEIKEHIGAWRDKQS